MSHTLIVNGQQYTVDVDADTPLLWVLRDILGITGTKFGCGMSFCGGCTVHMDGVAARSCACRCRQIHHDHYRSASTNSMRICHR